MGEITSRLRALGRLKLAAVPILRRRQHIVQPGLLLGLRSRAWIGGGDLHAGLGGQFLDRIHERQPALVGHPADRIAMRAAAKAVVKPFQRSEERRVGKECA